MVAGIGTAATGRNKTYRYYTCWSRARYGTTTCDAHRLPAEAFDTAVFTAMTNFYRDHHDLIAQAVARDAVDHDAATSDRRASTATANSPCATPAACTTSASLTTGYEPHVLMLIRDRNIQIITQDTAELIRELVLDTTRDYQPQTTTRTMTSDRCARCLETREWWT